MGKGAGLIAFALTVLFCAVVQTQEPAKRSELRAKTQQQLTEIAEGLDGVMGFVMRSGIRDQGSGIRD
jgi:hypothetical protein